MDSKSKKSNREGTGKVVPCKKCKALIPSHKKFCSRECYSNYNRVIIICQTCGLEKSLPKNKKDTKYCSIKCSNQGIDRKQSYVKAKNTLESKHGVDNPFLIKGYENLNIKRNGDKISQSLKNKSDEEKVERKNKISNTLKNKSDEEKIKIKEKRKNTNILLYNVESYLSKDSPFREEIKIKLRNSQTLKYKNWLQENNLELLDEYKGVKDLEGNIIYYKFKYIPTGEIFEDHLACGRLPVYKDPKLTIGISKAESEILEFIKNNYKDEIISNSRKLLKGLEIDIYLPNLKLAIEFNGLRWHSESMGKFRNYHLYKTQKCEEIGIQLIHIFEDEWVYKKDIVKSRILNLIKSTPNKIYARKCVIKFINSTEKNLFLNKNHIQGEDKSSIRIGLIYNNELVSIMTLGALRKVTGNKSKENSYELIRFCNKLNTNVIGGFSKLFKHFIKNYNPESIISYADRRWSIGNLYEKNNFKFIHNSQPNYWYLKHYNYREHRYKYNKQSLSTILPKYNPKLSEWENMKVNKYDRIWDCGSKKYIYQP
jgi:hypothetical protein